MAAGTLNKNRARLATAKCRQDEVITFSSLIKVMGTKNAITTVVSSIFVPESHQQEASAARN